MENVTRIDWPKIEKMTGKLARDIMLSGFKPDYIVGINRGGNIPAVMLSHYFNVPSYSLNIQLRDGNDNDCESNAWMAEDAFLPNEDGTYKNILIVDEMNDSGRTFEWLKADWMKSVHLDLYKDRKVFGETVRFAVLIENLYSEFSSDYTAEEIHKNDDTWIVFPWESWWE